MTRRTVCEQKRSQIRLLSSRYNTIYRRYIDKVRLMCTSRDYGLTQHQRLKRHKDMVFNQQCDWTHKTFSSEALPENTQ